MKQEVVIDRRSFRLTESDARGKFLAPDVSVLIARVPQLNGTREIYAHTRAQAREWHEAVCRDPAMLDGIPSDVVALIIDEVQS
jgi:hypothetical protein